jgi:hypothetical protein
VTTSWKDKLADLEVGYELIPKDSTREELFGRGVTSPASLDVLSFVARSEEESERIKGLAAHLVAEDHDRLAMIAAVAIDAMALFDQLLEKFETEKLQELFAVKAEASNALAAARAEVRKLLIDPSLRAHLNAKAKKVNDPKQLAKLEAKKLWIERHEGHRTNLKTVAMFADEVLRLWPELTSHKVVCGWSAEWGKEAKKRRNPAG